MEKLGYQILVTILLPGAILLAAALLVVNRSLGGDQTAALLATLLAKEWVAAALALMTAALLGTLLGSILDSIEEHSYDVWAAKELELTDDEYWEEWLKYVDSLETKTNPYIDQMALYFFFESRTAIATLVFALAWACAYWGSLQVLIAVGFAAVAVGLFFVSKDTHLILARFRHRRYAASAA
jgi:hypothetical protein